MQQCCILPYKHSRHDIIELKGGIHDEENLHVYLIGARLCILSGLYDR